MKAALYARVSTLDQHTDNQLVELRRYAAARGWDAREFVDHGVSGAKERRPALDAMVADVENQPFCIRSIEEGIESGSNVGLRSRRVTGAA